MTKSKINPPQDGLCPAQKLKIWINTYLQILSRGSGKYRDHITGQMLSSKMPVYEDYGLTFEESYFISKDNMFLKGYPLEAKTAPNN